MGGTRDTGDPAVVAITRDGQPHCTGTLVAQDVVLTAAHCVSGWSLEELSVLFASSVREPEEDARSFRLRDAWVPAAYPGVDHDVALLMLEQPAAVQPLPLLRNELSAGVVGESLRVVGYGKTGPSNAGGVKFEGFAKILELSETHLYHEPNTCPGDSGGPGFLTQGDAELLVGVHSRGTCGTGGSSVKIRVDRQLDFLLPGIGGDPANAKPPKVPTSDEYPEALERSVSAQAGKGLRGAVRCAPNRTSLALGLHGGSGTAHVYARLEDIPTLDEFDVDLPGPSGGLFMESDAFLPGIWNILVYAESDLSAVEVSVECI